MPNKTFRTNTTRIKYKKPVDRKINHYPDSLEAVDLIIKNLEKQIEENNNTKKETISRMSDFEFARWDAKRYLLKDQYKWLKELRDDIEIADIEHDMAIEGSR
jgi:hypothetical protein